MSTLFSKIVNGEIPCFKVAENDRFLAFLDIMPLNEGHTLVIPKVEVDYLFDLDDDVLSEMMVFAKAVAIKIKKAIPCRKVGVAVVGLEVPHAHIHLIPINTVSDMDFGREKLKLSQEDLKATAFRIQS